MRPSGSSPSGLRPNGLRSGGSSPTGPARRPSLLGNFGRNLAQMFPPGLPAPSSRVALWVGNLAATGLAAAVLLARQTAGVPAWDSLVAEDRSVYLPAALLHPWNSFTFAYAGYLQLVPRLIAEVVARLPLTEAAAGFVVAGALVASATAVFVFHASSGHIRRRVLRILLAASVVLLPTALIEISGTGVNSTWYLLFGAFWALLWRPRSRSGLVAAALVCFAAAASNILTVLYAPLVAARVIAMPRVREQVPSLAWLAGCIVQVPAVLTLSRQFQSTSFERALGFYGRNVVLAAMTGRAGGSALWALAGFAGAVALAGIALALVLCWAWAVGGTRVRWLLLAGVLLGMLLTFVPVLLNGRTVSVAFPPAAPYIRGSRYAQAPILIIDSVVIVAVDAFWRRGRRRAAQAAAVGLLAAALLTTWVTDFRYQDLRSAAPPWSVAATRAELACQRDPSEAVPLLHTRIPCARVHG